MDFACGCPPAFLVGVVSRNGSGSDLASGCVNAHQGHGGGVQLLAWWGLILKAERKLWIAGRVRGSDAIEAETAATKIAREKDQGLKVALERVSNLRTKFSRKKTQLKEKEQLIAGLEAALKTREDELSACTVEKSMLQRDHKKELGKVRDSLLELELSAAEVIDYVYSSVELKDQKSSSELLEMMPAELKKHYRFITNMCSSAVLAKVKSHYPGLEEP
ncbi:hypothetical protein EJB05_57261, partial [Eragrostis curvula]